MINKYKTKTENSIEFLIYGADPNESENSFIELVEKNIDLLNSTDDQLLPILEINNFVTMFQAQKARTRDKILEEEGIISFYDLQNAYLLLRINQLKKPVRVRKFVEEKYSEIINLEYHEIDETRGSENLLSDNSSESIN